MNTPKVRPKVYTVAEFAQAFAISPRLVRTLIQRGEIPAIRIGRSYRIPRKVAVDYLARALPPAVRYFGKPKNRLVDEQIGYLFPVNTVQ
jgi:excisionase family DNA binding protein